MKKITKKLLALFTAFTTAFCITFGSIDFLPGVNLAASAAETLSSSKIDSFQNDWNAHGWVVKKGFWANDLDTGKKVISDLQILLNYVIKSNLDVDGVLGNLTNQSILEFQKRYGLSQDGIVGNGTWSKLISVARDKLNSETSSKNTSVTSGLKMSGTSKVVLPSNNETDVRFYFEGYGIAGLAYGKSNNVDVDFHDAYLVYPGQCHIDCKIRLLSGQEGSVTLYLKDENGGYPMNYTTTVQKAQKDNIVFSGMSFPQKIKKGSGQHIEGTISSNATIKTINAAVVNSSGKTVLNKTVSPNSKSYSLKNSAIDNALTFGSLGTGDYKLVYTVNPGNNQKTYTHNFTVYQQADIKITFSGMSFPQKIKKGSGQHIEGTISSNATIKTINAAVVNSSGKTVLNKTVSPNSKSYSLKNSAIDNALTFGSLGTGDYKLVYTVNPGNNQKTYTHNFTVYQQADIKITFSGMSFPQKIKEGSGQHISGKITSTSNINKIQAIVTNSSGKTVLNKTVSPNVKSYSLMNSSLDATLTFGSLATGTYKLTYNVTSGSVTKSYYHSFQIVGRTPSSIASAIKRAKADIGKFNGRSYYKEDWCADYVSRYLRTYLGNTKIKASNNVSGLTANIVNSGNGTLYLYSKAHYNAVVKEANGGNVYSYAQFTKTGLQNTKLVSKSQVTPKQGDLILFRWGGSSTEMSHIGIVDSMTSNLKYVNTIEGNTTYNGTKNSNFVNSGQRTYNNAYIIGIIRMK